MDTEFENLLLRADALAGLGYSHFQALNAVGLGHHFLALPENATLPIVVDQCKRITEHVIPEVSPLAIVYGDDLVGLEGGAYGLAGGQLPEATGRCGYVIGVNSNMIAHDVDFGCEELSHHSHAHFASTVLSVALHEAIHHLLWNQPPACPPRQNDEVRVKLTEIRSRPADPRKEVRSHGPAFIRAALHVAHRVEQLGIHLVFPVITTENYGLGATRDWLAALEGEPRFREDEPLRDIINSPMPATFAKLEAERYGTAMAAARLSARNTLQPMQQLQTANVTPS